MRRRIIYFLTITLLFFSANLLITQIEAQVKPFNIKQILNAVASINEARGNEKKALSDKILKDIRQRGVDFPLTLENEKLLRGNGASNEFIAAIKGRPQSNIVITVGTPTSVDINEMFERSIEEGNIARDERDYVKAETAYRRAQTLKSKDSRATYGLGNIYADQQRWEEAEKAYRQAIFLEPDNAGAYVALSYVLTQPVVGSNLSERYTEAEKMARKAISIDVENPFAYDQLGTALELSGDISQETQNAYRKAIQIDPEFALAYAHLGRLLRRSGNANDSYEAYSKAIQFSTDVPTMILVADVMQSQQKFLESEQLLRRAIAIDPKHPTTLYLLGRALTTRDEFAEAEKILKKSVEVSPNSIVSYTLLSSLYLRNNKFAEAEKMLMQALKIVSPNERKRLAQEFEAVGDGFIRISKVKDAERLYKQGLALDGEKASLIKKLAKTSK